MMGPIFTRSLASVSLLALSFPAFAQDPVDPQAADDAATGKDIVVTGTLIRGKAPVGSNAIAIGEDKLEESGAISSNELLATVPQVTNYFNRVPLADLSIAVNQIQVSRPNIRNLAAPNSASSPTLVLVDGHRLAGVGVNQSSVDPDLIPTIGIERVDVVTEGGSATYGADAVAGVINFITRRRFDGVRVDASYGFADDYWQVNGGAIVGKEFGNGSAYLAYNYTKNDALFGRDRDFLRNLDYSVPPPYRPRDFTCANPNLAINTVIRNFGATIASSNFAAPGFVSNTFNRCDNSENSSAIPKAERHGALAGFSWDFGDRTRLDARAYYGERSTRGTNEPTGSVTVTAANPFVAPALPAGVFIGTLPFQILGSPVDNRAVVNLSFAPALGVGFGYQRTFLQEYGGKVEISHDLTDDWQVRALANYSQSDSTFNLNRANAVRLNAAGAGTSAATAINPFNVAATNSTLLLDIFDNELNGQAKDELIQARLLAEGKVIDLPGGEVRLAVGYEYMDDHFSKRTGNDIRVGALGSVPFATYDRNVHSVFGELQVPLIGPDNSSVGLHSLVLSAAGRFDEYSDFGSTFNPKFGFTYEVIEGFRFRGNWGTSFTAPNPNDQLGALNNTITAFPIAAFVRPGDTPQPGSFTVAIQGSQPNLRPQTADTWSVGVDLEPTRGLRFSASYYDVKFENILGTPTPNAGIFTDFPDNVQARVSGLTPAELRAFGALVPGGSAVVEPLIASGAIVYEAVDFRTGNFGILAATGLDFTANYRRETGFGGFDVGVNGNLQLSREQQRSPTSATIDLLRDRDTSALALQAIAGVDVGGLRAQGTFNHSEGYNIQPTTGIPVQTHVAAFNTFDLFFKYEFPGESLVMRDLSLTLNVKNVFDTDPPVLLRNGQADPGYANGFTIGRMFIVGLSKKF